MSTYLELVQALHTEVGAAGVAPTAVTNQVGEAARLVGWIRRADLKVQTKWINWKFLRSTFSSGNTTSSGVATLAKPTDHKTWDADTFTVINPGETEKNRLDWVEYDKIKNEILTTDTGPVGRVIIMPDNSLQFDPVPDGIYTIGADYYRKPTALAANGDISAIPEDWHESVILGRAMIFYANYENAPEILTQGRELYSEGITELENHQLPNQNYSRLRTGGGFEVIGGQFGDEFGSVD